MEKLPLKVGELIENYVKLHCEGINVKSGIHLSDIFTDAESMECFYKLLSSNKKQLIENGIEVNGSILCMLVIAQQNEFPLFNPFKRGGKNATDF